MTMTNIPQEAARGLPQTLRTAQEAIHLPEVQAILRKLSEYNLGVCMPHRHDEKTGGFQTLADDVMQVESGLAVSFQTAKSIAAQTNRFLPVAWQWHAGALRVASVCEMVQAEGSNGAPRYVKHKM